MDFIKQSATEVQEGVKQVVDAHIAYFQLWGFKVVVKSVAMLIKLLLLLLFASLMFFFVSMGLVYIIGNALGNLAYGFFIMGGIYLVLLILLLLFRNIVDKPVLRKFSDIYFNN